MRKLLLAAVLLVWPMETYSADVVFTPGSGATLAAPADGAGKLHTQPMVCDATTPTNCAPVSTSNGLTVQIASGSTVPLMTGAATAANQSTGNTSLASLVTNTTGLATSSNQTTGNTSLSSIVTNTTSLATHADAISGVFSGQNAAAPGTAVVMGGQFNTTPTTITTGNVSPFQMDSAGNLLVNVKTGTLAGTAVTVVDGGDVTLGSKADAATCATTNTAMSCFRQLHTDLTSPGQIYSKAFTVIALDVSTVTTGGTAVTALSAGHATAGGILINPAGASVSLCINQLATASGTTTAGSLICIAAGQQYNIIPSASAVSVISSDSSHPFGGYGLN